MVGNAELIFVMNATDQVGRRGLVDDHFRHPEVPGQVPDLSLEKISERIDRRRIIRVPCVVSQETLRLVTRTERERLELR